MTRVGSTIKSGRAWRLRIAPRRAGKTMIVTADDFGLSRAVNAGVIRSHRDGILTAASLMVTGAACEEAARLARDYPALGLGLHLVVCRGRAVLGDKLARVADAAGEFARNPTLAGMRYFFDRRVRSLLCDEIRAQIELQLSLTGVLGHLDGHLNFHVHPIIADILAALIPEYGIRAIRLPREAVFTTLALARDHAGRKLIEAMIFRTLSRRARRIFGAAGAQSSDWLFGLHQSGSLSEAYLAGIIARLRNGLTEIYTHPSDDPDDEPGFAEIRREVAILTSPRIRAALASAQVELTSFAALQEGR